MQRARGFKDSIKSKFSRDDSKDSSVTSKDGQRSSTASRHSTKNLLHGQLFLEIKEAKNLPDMEKSFSKILNKRDVTDAYVEAWLGGAKLVNTKVVNNDLNPKWNDSYAIEVCHFADYLRFKIQDQDHGYSEYIGSVKISIELLLKDTIIEGWFPIMKNNGKQNGAA